jgi:hypothetical protein
MTIPIADQIWQSPAMDGTAVIDRWEVVDRWWTAEPIHRTYRTLRKPTGEVQVEYRTDDGPWKTAKL